MNMKKHHEELMRLEEIEKKFKFDLDKNILTLNGYLYANLNSIKMYINKNISREDLKNKSNLYVLKYFDGYVLTKKDDTVQPFGIKLNGNWNEGYALDYHTIDSFYKNIRTHIAEQLYRLKYIKEKHLAENIAKLAIDFLYLHLDQWKPDIIVPVPPTKKCRAYQPVYEIAKYIGKHTEIPVDLQSLKKKQSIFKVILMCIFDFFKLKNPFEAKNNKDPRKKRKLLKNSFIVDPNALNGKDVLIIDDVYDSGETLKEICNTLKYKGRVRNIYVLTITKTRR